MISPAYPPVIFTDKLSTFSMDNPSHSQSEDATHAFLEQQEQSHQQSASHLAFQPQQPIGAAQLPPQPQPQSPTATVTNETSQITDPTKTSSSAFILGIHNFKALNDVDLPHFVKEHQATLSFPEKLMLMLTYVDKEYGAEGSEGGKTGVDQAPITWILDGRAFIIRSKEDLVKSLLPMFFRQAKFASFTRKLYRWGFRQVSLSAERMPMGNKREMIFGHECFQRDNKPLMAKMRSVTAAGTRRAIAASQLKQQKLQAQVLGKLDIEPNYTLAATSEGPSQAFISIQPAAASGPAIQGQPHVPGQAQQQPPAFIVLPPGMTFAPMAAPGTAAVGQQQPIGTTNYALPAPLPAQQEVLQYQQVQPQQLACLPQVHLGNSGVQQQDMTTTTTLQGALTMAHQQHGASIQQAPVAAATAVQEPQVVATTTTATTPTGEAMQQQLVAPAPSTGGETRRDVSAAPASATGESDAAQAAAANSYLASLQHLGINTSNPEQAAQQLQAIQSAQGGDSNSYMRAAIDMLLRYAASAAK